MATGPQFTNDPIELLSGDPNRIEPFMDQVWGPMLFGGLTFTGCTLGNYARRLPTFNGIPKILMLTGVAAAAGYYLDRVYRPAYFAEKDAKLRHYVSLHPEDFPVAERKKYADVFEPWTPIR